MAGDTAGCNGSGGWLDVRSAVVMGTAETAVKVVVGMVVVMVVTMDTVVVQW